MDYWENGMYSVWGLVPVFAMVTLWAAAVAGFIVAERSARHATPIDVRIQPPAEGEVERILAERLARGDIEAYQYRTMARALRLRSSS